MNAPAQAASLKASAAVPAAASPPRPPQSIARASETANAAAVTAIARSEALSASRTAARAAATPVGVTPQAAPTPAATPASEAAAVHPWHKFFADWPSQIPTRGILISRLNEASPFKAFMMRGDFLLLERVSPDSLGGRFLVIPFDEISTVKFTDPLKQPALEAAGFQGQLAH